MEDPHLQGEGVFKIQKCFSAFQTILALQFCVTFSHTHILYLMLLCTFCVSERSGNLVINMNSEYRSLWLRIPCKVVVLPTVVFFRNVTNAVLS